MGNSFDSKWSGVGTGGHLALDFTNTLDWRLRADPVELLHDFGDLMRWGWSAGALEKPRARALVTWAKAHPRTAARILGDALETREAIAEIFQAIARGRRAPAAPLARLEATCLRATAARTLQPAGTGASWEWRERSPEPERVAWTAALEAARLLESPEVERVRQCADAQCGWMFLDTSRNRSRRWCSMEACGNRNKVRGFYRRSKGRR